MATKRPQVLEGSFYGVATQGPIDLGAISWAPNRSEKSERKTVRRSGLHLALHLFGGQRIASVSAVHEVHVVPLIGTDRAGHQRRASDVHAVDEPLRLMLRAEE